jgi:hypothetical protein
MVEALRFLFAEPRTLSNSYNISYTFTGGEYSFLPCNIEVEPLEWVTRSLMREFIGHRTTLAARNLVLGQPSQSLSWLGPPFLYCISKICVC